MTGINNTFVPFALVLSALLTSCNGLFPELTQRDGLRFRVHTAPYAPEESATKVAYTNELTGNRERLDWVDGDLIRVYSENTRRKNADGSWDTATNWADYLVETHETVNGFVSRATVKPHTDGGGLHFGESGTHRFRGVFPSPESAPAGFGFSAGTLTASMPSDQYVAHKDGTMNPAEWYPQEMGYATLLAVSESMDPPFDENTEISLPFYPQYTAYEFEVHAGVYEEVTINGFSMSCTEGYLTASSYRVADGNYYTGTNPEVSSRIAVTSPGQRINVAFTGGLTVRRSEGPVRFTVLALAQTHREITISFNINTETVPRRLTLKTAAGVPLEFGPYKKYRIRGLSFPATVGVVVEDSIEWRGELDVLHSTTDPLLWDRARIFAPGMESINWE